jgi:hypothetical protein
MPQKTEFEIGGVSFEAKAYPPKVTVQNNIFPPWEELQNCRTCHFGRQLPTDNWDREKYHYLCKRWDDLDEHIGYKNLDNDCTKFVRKRSD